MLPFVSPPLASCCRPAIAHTRPLSPVRSVPLRGGRGPAHSPTHRVSPPKASIASQAHSTPSPAVPHSAPSPAVPHSAPSPAVPHSTPVAKASGHSAPTTPTTNATATAPPGHTTPALHTTPSNSAPVQPSGTAAGAVVSPAQAPPGAEASCAVQSSPAGHRQALNDELAKLQKELLGTPKTEREKRAAVKQRIVQCDAQILEAQNAANTAPSSTGTPQVNVPAKKPGPAKQTSLGESAHSMN